MRLKRWQKWSLIQSEGEVQPCFPVLFLSWKETWSGTWHISKWQSWKRRRSKVHEFWCCLTESLLGRFASRLKNQNKDMEFKKKKKVVQLQVAVQASVPGSTTEIRSAEINCSSSVPTVSRSHFKTPKKRVKELFFLCLYLSPFFHCYPCLEQRSIHSVSSIPFCILPHTGPHAFQASLPSTWLHP